MPQIFLFLLIFSCFLDIYFSDCCKLLANFQSSKKVGLTIFSSVLFAFTEEQIFRNPHSTIPEVFSIEPVFVVLLR